jgi:predicted GNAT family N-acyltransferase
MFKLKVIAHCEVSQNDLNEIIKVKTVAWPYPYEKQLKWLNENLNADDLHLLLLEDNITIAYLNLINIELEINNEKYKSLGVGNVCSAEKGKGFGNKLMKLTNQFIKKNRKPGLLFCKPELINFYGKFNWVVIEKDRLRLNLNNQNTETMSFNISNNVQSLSYLGNSF